MKETFDDILTSTLEELEKNPDMSIEELMNSQTRKYNVSEEAKESLAETFACLDKFAEKSESLTEARKAGLTRGQWMVNEIEQMTAQVRKSVDSPPGMLTEDHHHTVHEERQVCYSSHLRPKSLHL